MNWSYREHNKNFLCMIMAGGQGSRLQPLTRDRAKPAVHFGGTYRIIDFVLNNFINSGIFKIKVLTQFKSDSLNKHISAAWNLNASLDQYVDLVPAQMRTGGDPIYKMDVTQMVDFHLSRAALLTFAAIPVPVEEAHEFGIIEVDQDNRMIGFEEKPKQPKQMPGRPGWCLASMGNYIFTSKFLVRELLKHSSEGATDFGKDIIPALYPNYPVYVYDFHTNIVRGERAETKGYWRDVGTLDAFFDANLDICSENPPFDLYNNYWPIRTYNWNQPPARFFSAGDSDHPGAAIDSVVSAGCVIGGGRVIKSVLSPAVSIQKDALVEESILFPDVTIGPGAKVRRAIIEKGLHIPAGFEIGYDLERDSKMFHVTPSGIVVLAKDTIIKA